MIGKMYRPLKISTTPENRGYTMINKYKSNFGGIYNFTLNISVIYDMHSGSETIHLDFLDLTIPVLVENGKRLEDNSVITGKEMKKVESLRNLYRPTNITSKDFLSYDMQLKSAFPNKDVETEILNVTLQPIIIDGIEQLKISVKSETPVKYHANTEVNVAE